MTGVTLWYNCSEKSRKQNFEKKTEKRKRGKEVFRLPQSSYFFPLMEWHCINVPVIIPHMIETVSNIIIEKKI